MEATGITGVSSGFRIVRLGATTTRLGVDDLVAADTDLGVAVANTIVAEPDALVVFRYRIIVVVLVQLLFTDMAVVVVHN